MIRVALGRPAPITQRPRAEGTVHADARKLPCTAAQSLMAAGIVQAAPRYSLHSSLRENALVYVQLAASTMGGCGDGGGSSAQRSASAPDAMVTKDASKRGVFSARDMATLPGRRPRGRRPPLGCPTSLVGCAVDGGSIVSRVPHVPRCVLTEPSPGGLTPRRGRGVRRKGRSAPPWGASWRGCGARGPPPPLRWASTAKERAGV